MSTGNSYNKTQVHMDLVAFMIITEITKVILKNTLTTILEYYD